MTFSMVRLRKDRIKYFLPDKDGRGFTGHTGDAHATDNVLYATEWNITLSGGVLLMASKAHKVTYACPWVDVETALLAEEPEERKAAPKPGKVAGQ